ncbi:MAG: hypothetical protein ACK4SL_04135 [Candidatus Paceibacteria bacterium]
MSIELINNRITSFTPEYRDFVMSDFSDVVAAKIAQKESFDEDTETAIANMIFLYTILILSDYELTEALVADCGLGMNEALRITKSILSTMPPEMLEAQRDAYAELMKSDNPIDEKIRRDIIAAQPERQKLVYLYTKTNPHLRVLLEQFALPEEQVEAGIMLLGDIILGFYRTEDTVPLLQQELGLDPKTAALLGAEVLEFLTSITDPNWQPPTDAPRIQETPTNQVPLKAPAGFTTPTPLVVEPSAVVEPTPVYQPAPVGYMSTPTPNPTPIYQSTQPTPAPVPLSTIPSYTPAPTPPTPPAPAPAPAPDRPRWSTEI